MREAPDRRPWALLVTRNFPPLVGGMEKVNQNLLEAIAEQWQVALCGPRGSRGFAPAGVLVSESAIRPLSVFLMATVFKAVWHAFRRRPRLVFAGSGLTAPITWLAARLVGARAAVYLHGLDIIAPSRTYQSLWLPFIRACDLVVVNSENTARLASASGVAGERIVILHPGTEIPRLAEAAGPAFRARFDLGQRPILLSVGRLTRRKGLAQFVVNAMPRIVSSRPDALLTIIGEEAVDALHGAGGAERERILLAARSVGIERNVRFLGRLDEAALGSAYQGADCHVFPVLHSPGDVEGFGMVALESAAHGLRTVAFNVGGVADAVAAGESGLLVPGGDYALFADGVLAVLDQARDASSTESCRRFAAGKSWDRFGEKLRQLIRAGDGH